MLAQHPNEDRPERLVFLDVDQQFTGGTATRGLQKLSYPLSTVEVRPSTIYDWRRLGKLPHYKLGSVIRFRAADLDRVEASASAPM